MSFTTVYSLSFSTAFFYYSRYMLHSDYNLLAGDEPAREADAPPPNSNRLYYSQYIIFERNTVRD